MGWLFSHPTQSALIQECIAPIETADVSQKTLAHALRREGNLYVLWTVTEHYQKVNPRRSGNPLKSGETARYITCILLDVHGNLWGYKAIQEAMEPYYYSCPKHFLTLATHFTHEEWRRMVRNHS